MKNRIIVSLLTLILIFSCVNVIPNKVLAEDEPFTFESVLDECAELTATDELEGVYFNDLGNKVLAVKDFKKGVLSDYALYKIEECLYAIIPIQLLCNVGEYYYEGEEYAFYVKTELVETDLYQRKCEVVIIDYSFEFNDETRSLTAEIDIFSRIFVFNYEKDLSLILQYEPISSMFFLNDIAFSQMVKNEHNLNSGDNGYSKNNDYGSILDTFCLIASGAYDIFHNFVYEDYISVAYNDNVELNIYPSRTEQLNNGDTPYTKALQLDNFNNGTNIFVNDYMRLITVLNDNTFETRAAQGIKFNLAKIKDGDIYHFNKDSNTFVLEDDIINDLSSTKADSAIMFEKSTEIALGNNTGYLIASDSVQDFMFTPTINGLYNFSIGENYLIEIFDNEEEIWTIVDRAQILKANTEYKIRVKCAGETLPARAYNLNIEFCPEAIVAGDNFITFDDSNYEFASVNFAEGAYYRFVSTKANTLFSLYDENLNVIEEDKSQIIIKADGKKYYLKLASENLLTEAVNVKCFKERKIQFYTNTDEVINSITFNVNENLSLPEPTPSSGYEFEGWYESEDFSGNKITNENVLLINKADFDLYAKYQPIEYEITYHVNGGTSIEKEYYTIEDIAVLNTNVAKENYTFIGWYESEDFSGNAVTYIHTGTIGNKEYYAKWVITLHNITLNVGENYSGATITDTAKTITYGEFYTLPVPIYNGYEFNGWEYNGELVTNGQGEITFLLEEENVTLIANWSAINFYLKVEITAGESSTVRYLTADGLEVNAQTVTKNDFVSSGLQPHKCPSCWALENRDKVFREGYIFSGLYYGESLACWDELDPAITENAVIELTAEYIKETYIIKFYNYAEVDMPAITVEYGESINWPTIKEYNLTFKVTDYEKNSNFTDVYAIGYTFKSDEVMKDLTPNSENTQLSVILYVDLIKTAKITQIQLVDEFNKTITEHTATYDTELVNVFIPEMETHDFYGWYYRDENNELILYIDSNGDYVNSQNGVLWDIEDETLVLYASWGGKFSKITFDFFGGYGGTEEITVRYGDPLPWIVKPQKTYKAFAGYYELTHGRGKCYYSGQNTTSEYICDFTSDKTLFAYWEDIIYDIVYANLMPDVTASVYEYMYGEGISQMPTLTQSFNGSNVQLSVRGWYRDSSLTEQTYSISQTSTGTVTLYAKYDYYIVEQSKTSLNYTIVEGNTLEQPYIQFDLSKLKNKYTQLKQCGFENLKIELSVLYDEVNDGYQEFYIYNGTVELWAGENDCGKWVETNVTYESGVIILDIDSWENADYLAVRFNAHGDLWDKWIVRSVNIVVQVTN